MMAECHGLQTSFIFRFAPGFEYSIGCNIAFPLYFPELDMRMMSIYMHLI
jgi:hypothetical protein